MEEIEKKLSFGNSCIQFRAVLKLLAKVISSKPPNQLISSSMSKQIPELDLLWEKCGDSIPNVSSLCSQALASLVTGGQAEPGYIINGFLGAIPSARNQNGPVSSLVDLLMIEIQGQTSRNKEYDCPFSLRSPIHPLIVILRDIPSAWPAVLVRMYSVFKDESKRNYGLKMLKPVLQYILCDPNCPTNYVLLRTAIYEQILRDNPVDPLHSLFSYISWLQLRSTRELIEVMIVTQRISETLLNPLNEDKNLINTDSYLLMLLALCHHFHHIGFGLLGFVTTIKDISENLKHQKHSLRSHMSIVVLATLLEECTGLSLHVLLQIAESLLARSGVLPSVAAVLTVPVLQIISDSPDIHPITKRNNQAAAIRIMKLIEKLLHSPCNDIEFPAVDPNDMLSVFTELSSQGYLCTSFALSLHNLKQLTEMQKWIEFIKMLVKKGHRVPQTLFHFLCGCLVIECTSPKILQSIVEMLQVVASSSPEQASMLFVLLLYKLKVEPHPGCQLQLLESFPLTASHTLCVPPIISVIQLMSEHPQLKSQAVHLMVLLWKKQDRCFPYLQKMLTDHKYSSEEPGATDFFIAQAAAVKEVCETKPSQHGGELLGIISSILTESTDEESSPATALALDGVYILCESKVLDIESTWKMLAPKLSKVKRPLVMTRLFNLLSLVPQLHNPTFEYDKFMGTIASILWKHVSCERNPSTVAAAFKALAEFPPDNHLLKLLPSAAKVNLKLPSSMSATPFEMGKQPEDVLSYTPGYCFLDLLKSLEHGSILEGYSKFLSSLVYQEVKEMPRSIHHIAKRAAKPAAKIKAVAEIPGLLCSQYETKQHSAIQGSIAVGLLLSYEPPIEVDKDGQPTVRFLLKQGEFYAQVMGALIQDVSLDYNEWRRCVLLSSAWAAFMDRAFTACEESRRKQIEMDKRHGRLPGSAEEVKGLLATSWLWVRDNLMSVIQSSSKGKPSSQANAILVIGGLVAALHRHASSLDEEAKQLSTENNYLNHTQFVSMAVDTILCIVDPHHRHKGDTFTWLLSHSSKLSSTAPTLVRSCAAIAACHLIPVLLASGAGYTENLCEVILQQLSYERSPVVEYYFGVGVGSFVQTLCREAYADSSPSNTKFLRNIFEKLDEISVGEDGDSRIGPIVGLTLCVAAFCLSGKSELMACAKDVCERFNDKIYDEDPSSVSFEVLCVCTSSMMCAASLANQFPMKRIEELMSWFDKMRQRTPQCGGTTSSLGILLETLQQLGHPKSAELKESLMKQWIQTFASEGQPTLSRLAALKGLCAIHTEGGGLIQIPNKVSSDNLSSNLSDLIRLMIQVIMKSRDSALQNYCSWSVGELFSAKAGKQTMSIASSNYSYLNDKSVLKPLINFLTKSTYSGDPLMYKHIVVCLSALNQSFSRPLPPLNWVAVLSPFLQSEQGSKITRICLEIALQHCSSSSSAAALVESWISPPLVTTLKENSIAVLLSSLHIMVKCLPSAKLQPFIKTAITDAFSNVETLYTNGQNVIQALTKAIQVVDLPPDNFRVLHQAVESLIESALLHFSDMQQLNLWDMLCECAALLSDEDIDRITDVTNSIENLIPLTAMTCHLIETGRKPLYSVMQCIEAAENLSQSERRMVIYNLWMLFLKGCVESKSEVSQPEKCTGWCMELMEKTKSLLNDKRQFWISAASQVISYNLGVCAATLVGCTGLEASYALWPAQNVTETSLISLLPYSLPILFTKKSWDELVEKTLEFILLLLQSNHIPKELRPHLEECLVAFRGWKEFSKFSIWSQALSICARSEEL